MAATSYIRWRGFKMTPDFRDAVRAAEERAGFTFRMTQGGFNAGGVSESAGTHDGDAGDWSIRGMSLLEATAMIEALRWAGIAASLRTTKVGKWGVRAQGFPSYHVHGVPNGWGRPSRGAVAQAVKYRAGRDGLASNGADVGPGHVGNFRQRRSPQKPAPGPGLPGTGDKPATPAPAPTGGLSMADITTITAQLSEIIAQNKAIHNDTSSRGALDEAARKVAAFPVSRGGVKIPWIQDTADTRTAVVSLAGEMAGLRTALVALAGGKSVDLAAIEAAAKRGTEAALKAGMSVNVATGGAA